MAEALSIRSRLASILTFGGKRNVSQALGYAESITYDQYLARFKRNGVARRIVRAASKATWRGGPEVIEDEDPQIVTPFEAAFVALDERVKVWHTLQRADALAGIGRYAVVLIGAPGDLSTPLDSLDEVAYLTPFGEGDARIESLDQDSASPRFGQPEFYFLGRAGSASKKTVVVGRRVHYSRVLHIADDVTDDAVYADPRLESVWDVLDDLDKIRGGGSEAFWRRVDGGKQFDLDPTLEFGEDSDEITKMRTQLDEYEHGLRRYLTTRGVKVNDLGSDVADIKSPLEAIFMVLSVATGIPQRVLMGSEQGKLAAKQDAANWDNQMRDRQLEWAEPCVVRPFVDRLIALGALPEPAAGYDVRWSSLTKMDDEQRAVVAEKWAGLNQKAGEEVVTVDELRERVLDLPPLADVTEPSVSRLSAAKKGGAPWVKVHRVADRFRGGAPRKFPQGVRVGVGGGGRGGAARGDRRGGRGDDRDVAARGGRRDGCSAAVIGLDGYPREDRDAQRALGGVTGAE